MPIISVWHYNDMMEEWIQKDTNKLVSSFDEQKYFRVIIGGIKHYYHSSNDYLNHRKYDIDLLFDYKMDKIDKMDSINNISYNLYTVNNQMINQLVTEV